jgi:hypothetical protein
LGEIHRAMQQRLPRHVTNDRLSEIADFIA